MISVVGHAEVNARANSQLNLLKQWNLYYADTFGTFPSFRLIEGVRLMRVVKIAQCLQHSTVVLW